MKRILALLLVIAVTFAFVSCHELSDAHDNATTPSQTTVDNIWEPQDIIEQTTTLRTTKATTTKATTTKLITTKPITTRTFATATQDNSPVVYITPTGERYHYRATCAGKNAIETTLKKASINYTPCKKCAS